jgi:hypothetical protein
MSPSQPIRYDLEVQPDGRLEMQVPLPVGSHVTVYIVPESNDDYRDLLAASTSSTQFWDNPEDDEDWNDA